jgi:hypothetical protein
MSDSTLGYAQSSPSPMTFEEAAKPGGAPTNATLAAMLAQKRMTMLSELRDIEQALEALEKQPEFEPTMNRVMKILQRRY